MAESFALPAKPELSTLDQAKAAVDQLYKDASDRVADCVRLHAMLCAASKLLESVKASGAQVLSEGHAMTLMQDLSDCAGDTINTKGTAARLYHEAHVKRHQAETQAKASNVNMLIHRDKAALAHLLVQRALELGHNFGDTVVTGDLTHQAIARQFVKENEKLLGDHHQANLK